MPPVLHLIDSGGFYGAERVLLELLIELRHSAYPGILGCLIEPHADEPEIARRARAEGVTVHVFPTRRGLDRDSAADIRDYVDAHGIALIHCHGYKPNILCGLFMDRRIPRISTAHGWAQGSGLKVSLYNWLDRLALKKMDGVVGVSEALVQQLRGAGVTAKLIWRIPNGIRVWGEGLRSQTARQGVVKQNADNQVVLGAAGRLAPVKGYAYLLAAMQEVVSQYPRCRLIIAGNGPLKQELESLRDRLGLGQFVHFAGFLEDMGEFFRRIDVFLMPSLSEGLPMALLEAMACGKACIASEVGGVPEVLSSPDLGILVPPAQPSAMAKAILSVIRDEGGRVLMGEKARRVVLERFSVERMAANYLEFYGQIAPAA
jgi:glycosyltransferase involved in cell wall biosynthesis